MTTIGTTPRMEFRGPPPLGGLIIISGLKYKAKLARVSYVIRRLLGGLLVVSLATLAHATNDAKPTYGNWGFDTAGADFTTPAGDDFFRYANGTWLDQTPIPGDKSDFDVFEIVHDTVEARLHGLMEEEAAKASAQPSDVAGKVGAFYKSFMDEARIEKLGAEPIRAELDAVRAATTRDALAALMGQSKVDFEPTLFNISTDVDLKDPKHYAVYLRQGGLGLPDRDYYLSPEFVAAKTAYQTYIGRLLQLIGWPEPDARASDIIDFETKIAEVSWTKAQDRDRVATYNPMSLSDLEALTPGFPWRPYLESAKLAHIDRVVVAEKSAFPKIATVYQQASLQTINAWHAFHIADNAAFYLSKNFAEAYFDLHEKNSGRSA